MPARIRVTGLSYGPHGVGRLDGKVIFTRGVVPGEDVDIEVEEDRGSFAYARLVQVVDPSPDRRQPPCPYLPRCGGCPWQHLDYSTQLRAKQQNLSDHLQRIAHLPNVAVAPIIASPSEFAYRSRLTLRTEGGQVGFYATASHDLVPIDHCLLAGEEINAAIAASRDLISRLSSPVRRLQIASGSDEVGLVLVGEVEGRFHQADESTLTAWLQAHTTVRGIVLHGKRWRRTWGDDLLTVRPLPDEPLRVHAGAFTQVNPAGNHRMVDTVLTLGEFAATDRVIDLYAGAGNFSLPLARRVTHVTAVEQDQLAATDAMYNAQRAGLTNLRVINAASHHAVHDLLRRRQRFNVAVLDPPRSGAAELIGGLLELRPRVVVYVSCNPATLARDLRSLAAAYRVEHVQPIDLFPQTYHVETVVRAVLTC